MIAIKIGRNDLCPCGSEKKFKKCCITKTNDSCNAHHNIQLALQLQHFEASICEKLKSFFNFIIYTTTKEKKELDLPFEINGKAIQEFIKDTDIEEKYLTDKSSITHSFFYKFFNHWLLFYWKPQYKDGTFYENAETLIEIYTRGGYAQNPSPLHYALVDASRTAYYSFYEITDIMPGLSITAHDLLLDTSVTFLYASAYEGIYIPGAVIFVQLITVDNVVKPFGIPPFVFFYPTQEQAHSAKDHVAQLKDTMLTDGQKSLTKEYLHAQASLLRATFFRMVKDFDNAYALLKKPETSLDESFQNQEALECDTAENRL